ncbi:MAG: sensor histidine kinase [Sphingobacteriaceae bacterium]|nr:sensor histidine kinase [Sphingobacteriaceae bacterium]
MLQKILDIGLFPEISFYQKREVRILNIISLITIFGMVLGGTTILFIKQKYPISLQLFIIFYNVFILYSNYKRRFNLSATTFVIGLSCVLLYVGEYYPEATASYLFYFPALFCIGLLHNPEKHQFRTHGLFLILIIGFVANRLFDIQLYPEVNFNAEEIELLFNYNILFCILLTLSLIIIMIGMLNKQYNEVINLLDKTKSDKIIIENSLHEKEILISEIQHRVKNNLAVLIGLFNMQKNLSKNEETIEALSDAKSRVMSIAMVHQSLYKKKDLSKINLKQYLVGLANEILDGQQLDFKVDLTESIENIEGDITKAVPLGLITNECITNCLKHAFNQNTINPTVYISLSIQFGSALLKISDNGNGFDVKQTKNDSLGLTLIEALSEQLDGQFHYESKEGNTEFRVKFPL